MMAKIFTFIECIDKTIGGGKVMTVMGPFQKKQLRNCNLYSLPFGCPPKDFAGKNSPTTPIATITHQELLKQRSKLLQINETQH